MKQFIEWLDRDAPEWICVTLLMAASFGLSVLICIVVVCIPWIIPLAIIAFLIYTGVLYRAYLKENDK